MLDKTMRISCSSWQRINVEAIANFSDDIKLSEPKYSDIEKCYTKKVSMTLTADSTTELYELLQHMNSDCDDNDCKYCDEVEDDEEDNEYEKCGKEFNAGGECCSCEHYQYCLNNPHDR